MPVSTVSICNIALGKLGGNTIMSLDDGTTEADLCKNQYETSRDLALAAVDWTFARKRAYLTPLAGDGGVIIGADFSSRFQLPTDCLTLRFVSADGSFTDRLQWEKEGKTLLAEKAHLYIKYTYRITEPTEFDAAFVMLYATQLAADICTSLTASASREEALKMDVVSLVSHACGADGVQSLPQRQKAHRLIDARFRGPY